MREAGRAQPCLTREREGGVCVGGGESQADRQICGRRAVGAREGGEGEGSSLQRAPCDTTAVR